MEFLFISDLIPEMRRQLVEDMAAQLRLGDPRFHSAKGCIKFTKPRLWNLCPIIQIDFCLVKEWDHVVQIILWISRRPDEDDFFTVVWPIDSWNNIALEAEKLCIKGKEADDE